MIEQAVKQYFAAEMHFLVAVAEGLHAVEIGDLLDHAVVIEDLAEFRRRVAEKTHESELQGDTGARDELN